jgi:hypothetical protein
MREFACPKACTDCPANDQACHYHLREEALRHAPGNPVRLLRPAPVKVRSLRANAVAYTVTDVLVEWDGISGYHLRWEASWLVRRVQQTPARNYLQEAP